MRVLLALAIASLLTISLSGAAETTEVSTPPATYYLVVEGGEASVWAEANGVTGLQTTAEGSGASLVPADEQLTPSGKADEEYKPICIDLPESWGRPAFCLVGDAVGIVYGVVVDVLEEVGPIGLERDEICVTMPPDYPNGEECV